MGIVQYDSLDSWPSQEGGAEPSDGSRNKRLFELSRSETAAGHWTHSIASLWCHAVDGYHYPLWTAAFAKSSPAPTLASPASGRPPDQLLLPHRVPLSHIALPAHHPIKKGCWPSQIVCSSFRQMLKELSLLKKSSWLHWSKFKLKYITQAAS